MSTKQKKDGHNQKKDSKDTPSKKEAKKDPKKDKAAKLEAKKARQASKQEKASVKRAKKELKESGEEDIEAILAEFSAKDRARTAVSVVAASQPSPRSNFSFTALPNGEMLLFGGEFCDGEGTTVYNDLFRWNVERNEWKLIESLNTPPPRCSHQAVFYKDHLYIFGGEYATLDQFHHYKDFWCLDLKTNAWTEIRATGDIPSARSGHRMVVWRNYLVLFGGFYEAMRDVRWFNDLYLFSFQEQRWTQVTYRPNSQVPKPRSGVQMCVHALEDMIYIYGGYSKEKVPGQKKEGKIHEDMWMLNMKPMLGTAGAASAGGRPSLDTQKAVWQKISKKGHFPSARCGAVMTVYKNKAILFGGVFDDEGIQHSMISTFYNDMYAFDMERRKWYQLGIRSAKQESTEEKRQARKAAKKLAAAAGATEGPEDVVDEEDDDEEDADGVDEELDRYANGNFFGYIDETGAVVYIDMDHDEPPVTENVIPESSAAVAIEDVAVIVGESGVAADSQDGFVQVQSAEEILREMTLQEAVPTSAGAALSKAPVISSIPTAKSSKSASAAAAAPNSSAAYVGPLSKYFIDRTEPSPRINPCLMIRGSTMYVYGGVTELGDVEVTLDDCWTLDLNKRDRWRCVLPGNMHNLIWKGEEDCDTGTEASEGDLNDDSDDSDTDDSDSDSGSDEEHDEAQVGETEAVTAAVDTEATESSARASKSSGKKQKDREIDEFSKPSKASKDKSSKSSKSSKRATQSEGGDEGVEGGECVSANAADEDIGGHGAVSRRHGGAGAGLRQEIETLRSQIGATDSNRTPLSGEALRAFYSRTAEYWSSEVIRQWRESEAASDSSAILSEKDLKRQGFLLAEARFNELIPVLARLNELEEQQMVEEEDDSGRRGRGQGDRKKSSGSKKR